MAINSKKLLKKFGSRVRELRLQQRLTQEDLAFASGLHRTYIGAIERGERNVSLKNIALLANALSIKITELFTFEDFVDDLDR